MSTYQALSFLSLALLIAIFSILFLWNVIKTKSSLQSIPGLTGDRDDTKLITADIEGIGFSGYFEGAVIENGKKYPLVVITGRKPKKMPLENMFKAAGSAFLFQALYNRFPEKCIIRYSDGTTEDFLLPQSLINDFKHSLSEALKVKTGQNQACRTHNRPATCENCPFSPVCPDNLILN
jgi:hypothetical protein